ncbi:hypothetical protein WJX75_006288 [Coccomyxa subellipsoidea]|uniref:Uncharacterized protein n=1 Tax=Coccomyxa subellipsoidea TaxID=248742 RepID=A0ABR2YIC3_9CHLO
MPVAKAGRHMLQATSSAAYLASSQASDAAQAPDSNLGGRTLLQATPSDAYATTSGKQGKSAGAPFVSSAPAPSMTMAYQTNQGKQGQGMSATVAPPQQGRHLLQGDRVGTADSGLSARSTGSQTISSTGGSDASGSGASGSGASTSQGSSQATDGASIAPAPMMTL